MAIVYSVAEPTPATPLVPLQSHGNHRIRVVELDADGGAYTVGGDSVTAASVGLNRIEYGDATVKVQGATTIVLPAVTLIPQTDGSVLVKLWATTGAELAAVAPGTALIIQARLYGK